MNPKNGIWYDIGRNCKVTAPKKTETAFFVEDYYRITEEDNTIYLNEYCYPPTGKKASETFKSRHSSGMIIRDTNIDIGESWKDSEKAKETIVMAAKLKYPYYVEII